MAHPSSYRRPSASKSQGWSSFTRLQHQQRLHPASDFLSQLPASQPSQFLLHHPQPRLLAADDDVQLASSFADVLKKPGLPLPRLDAPALGSHAGGVSRLRALHIWADESLITDVLQAFDLDEERASAYLLDLSSRVASSDESDKDCAVPSCEKPGSNLIAPSAFASLPVEPEWEEDDLYLAARRDALKKSRAREKHSLGAYRAFVNGDYERAKLLSKKAREEGAEAEELHAEAARQIFSSRNSNAHKSVWDLDLHGLHVREAIVVLQQRLSDIETALANNSSTVATTPVNFGRNLNGDGKSPSFLDLLPLKPSHPNSELSGEKQGSYQGYLPAVVPSRQGLTVVTGVGNHSRGGVSLPRAVKSFLLENRYKFEELRPGTILVHPKFHLLASIK